MLSIRRIFRVRSRLNWSSNSPTQRWTKPFSKQNLRHAIHVMAPSLTALLFAGVGSGVAHAQGTMDFSGAQTLMTTFKTLMAYVRRMDEGTLSRLLVEASILLASSRGNPTTVLRDAASTYKVDTDAIAAKVKQEFAVKARAKKDAKPVPKVKQAA
jgi:hypothetical protein